MATYKHISTETVEILDARIDERVSEREEDGKTFRNRVLVIATPYGDVSMPIKSYGKTDRFSIVMDIAYGNHNNNY